MERRPAPLPTRMHDPQRCGRVAGIEALVWLIDVAGHSRDQAADLIQWTTLALLLQALADAGIE